MFKSTDKIIIAGFPGVGKTKAGEILKDIVIDCESSDFHWEDPLADNKVAHFEWPENYLKLIYMLAYETDGLAKYVKLDYICCSTHSEVLGILRKFKIPFIIVVPEDKDSTIARYRERGNSEAFIKKLEENWEEWMNNFASYNMPIIKLPPDMYLSDFLSKDSTYDYLITKIDEVEKYILSTEEDTDSTGDDVDNFIRFLG